MHSQSKRPNIDSLQIDSGAPRLVGDVWAPPASALLPYIVAKLGNIPELGDLRSGHGDGYLLPSQCDWIVQPGLLWYHAPLIAIELVSKHPYSVDWAAKPPFPSLYDDEDRLKEGVFLPRWSKTMTTRPERKAKLVKKVSRRARIRAEEAAEELEREELQARLIWNLREIQPRPPSLDKSMVSGVTAEPSYEDDTGQGEPQNVLLLPQMAPEMVRGIDVMALTASQPRDLINVSVGEFEAVAWIAHDTHRYLAHDRGLGQLNAPMDMSFGDNVSHDDIVPTPDTADWDSEGPQPHGIAIPFEPEVSPTHSAFE